jgi:hypothetical protein
MWLGVGESEKATPSGMRHSAAMARANDRALNETFVGERLHHRILLIRRHGKFVVLDLRQTDRQTHRHTDTDTQIHRHTDTQTHRHTDTQTQTHRHTDTKTHRHTDTQRQRHTDRERHTHRQTQTHRHTATHTDRQTDTQTHRQTHRQTDRHIHTMSSPYLTLKYTHTHMKSHVDCSLYLNVRPTSLPELGSTHSLKKLSSQRLHLEPGGPVEAETQRCRTYLGKS